MKKIIILFILFCFFSVVHSSTNTTSLNKNPVTAYEVYVPVGNTGQLISLMDLSQINLKEFEKLSGKKMKLLDKINFKIGQRELKKSINRDGTFNNKKIEKYFNKATLAGGISLGGLALGLFLSLIGVLIAYLISGDNKKKRITWAWIGAAIGFIIWGAILI